jgi:hypothetical protein
MYEGLDVHFRPLPSFLPSFSPSVFSPLLPPFLPSLTYLRFTSHLHTVAVHNKDEPMTIISNHIRCSYSHHFSFLSILSYFYFFLYHSHSLSPFLMMHLQPIHYCVSPTPYRYV